MKNKKLVLKKIVIANLNQEQLAQVCGGIASEVNTLCIVTCMYKCNEDDTCA